VVGAGAGTITNNGRVRVLAGASVATGSNWSPIVAGTWGGTGSCQAVGGTWSATSHKFTASSVASGTSGLPVPLDLASVQRTLIDDNAPGGTGWEVGASFPATASTTNITFTATAMSKATLDTLRALLPTKESVLSGWDFAAANFTVSSTNPLYLSFGVDAVRPSDDFEIWQHVRTLWTKYDPFDLTFDGTYASFTASSLAGYALVSVPEPSTLALLAIVAIGLLGYAWRRRKGMA
jgi:hypothetical protein